jgi:glycerophosphoryl diester phosphodiesterase
MVVERVNLVIVGPSSLVADAHAAGLLVHPYTFRAESVFHPLDFPNDPVAEIALYLGFGIDGFFTDQPDVGVTAVPEPGQGLITLLGLAGIVTTGRRRLERRRV